MYDQVSPNSWRLNPQLLSTTETNEPEKLSLACQQSLKPVLRYRSFFRTANFLFFPWKRYNVFIKKKTNFRYWDLSRNIFYKLLDNSKYPSYLVGFSETITVTPELKLLKSHVLLKSQFSKVIEVLTHLWLILASNMNLSNELQCKSLDNWLLYGGRIDFNGLKSINLHRDKGNKKSTLVSIRIFCGFEDFISGNNWFD